MEIKTKTPLLFIGHGSPMNIIAVNEFTRSLRAVVENIERPDAILVVSAHWLTEGSYVTAGRAPQQIYDFYGFPRELYMVNYEPPGSSSVARMIGEVTAESVLCDEERGIDHAAWAVLKHMYPDANIPVLELSIDRGRLASYHFEFAKKLKPLREKNILVIGSGNIVHNLYEIDMDAAARPFSWAVEFDEIVKEHIVSRNFERLVDYPNLGGNVRKAIPTNDHYLPMLYPLALADEDEPIRFFHESIQNASISMRSFIIGG